MTTNGTNATPIPTLGTEAPQNQAQAPTTPPDPLQAQIFRVGELGTRVGVLLNAASEAFEQFVYETSILFQVQRVEDLNQMTRTAQEATNVNKPTDSTDKATTA